MGIAARRGVGHREAGVTLGMSAFEALGIAIRPDGPVEQRLACPKCERGPRDDALGVNVESGAFHCFRCGWSGRASSGETRTASITRLDDPARAERVRQRLRQVWRASVALGHKATRPVQRYLEHRGLAAVVGLPMPALRAHPALAYYDGAAHREVGRFPALLALLTDRAGRICTVHATYLRADGHAKAPVGNPKKILGTPIRGATRGGSIRLFAPSDGRLGVAEGIESALSLALIRRIPTWASYCADNLERICLPPGLRELEIGVDVDDSGAGERAARALAARVLRLQPSARVQLIFPDGTGPRDLNDELRLRNTRSA
jgi:hypothetical protein